MAEGALSGGSSLKTGSAATGGVSQAGADRGGASAHGGAFLSELRKRMFPKTRAPK